MLMIRRDEPTSDNRPSVWFRGGEMNRVYVASRVRHAGMWQEWRGKGVPIISSWIDEAGEDQTDSMSELWRRILLEVAQCDRLVFFALPDDFPHKGALVEVGAALAMGKLVIVCLPGVQVEERSARPVGSWMYHPLVRRVDNLAYALPDPDGHYGEVIRQAQKGCDIRHS